MAKIFYTFLKRQQLQLQMESERRILRPGLGSLLFFIFMCVCV